MHTENHTITDIVTAPEIRSCYSLFEKKYLALRQKEQRVYTDEELAMLPDVPGHHPHHVEWQLRKRSADKLKQWFLKKQQPLSILEVGCGNGWLAKQLASVPGAVVTGSDINFTELQQAAKVFTGVPGLQFVHGDIRHCLFEENIFDAVIFAASIQYFPSLQQIIPAALSLLKPGGELHILDSPFYKKNDLAAAQKRTADYYLQAGFPEMANHYFHHTLADLLALQAELLYDPASLQHFFAKNKNPFPWACIKNMARLA